MTTLADERPITRINTFYVHPPFLKELEKRRRETRLIDSLEECIVALQRNPRQPGLNLEQIDRCGGKRIFSARINLQFRLVLADLNPGEAGLLFFDDHNVYRWIERNRRSIPGMLEKVGEFPRGGSLKAPLPFPRADEDTSIAVRDFGTIKKMLAVGMERYLAHLDGDQTYLAQASIGDRKGVTLIKGGAGTGKTALAVARVAHLCKFPEIGYGRVLYLCFNKVLAETVGQILDGQFGGRYPRDQIEVARITQWSQHYLSRRNLLPPVKTEGGWLRNRIGLLFVRHPELRQRIASLTIQDIENEIRFVLRPNGFATEDEYLRLERHGMKTQLKQVQRSAVWSVYCMLPEVCENQVELEDLPGLALSAVVTDPAFVPYRSVVTDEAQDFTPVMVRLSRALTGGDDRRLVVLADAGQSIYPNGFFWAQREIRARGGQVTYLRTTYRTTREIHALAHSLYGGVPDAELQRDLGETHPPVRTGPLPELSVHASTEEEGDWLASAIRRDLDGDGDQGGWQPEQIAILAPTRSVLRRIGAALESAGLPMPPREGDGSFQLKAGSPTVKLSTIHGSKGLDFPVVYVTGLTRRDLFGEDASVRPLLYVGMTRSSFRLVLSTVSGKVHPLIEALPADCYTTTGSGGERFVIGRVFDA